MIYSNWSAINTAVFCQLLFTIQALTLNFYFKKKGAKARIIALILLLKWRTAG